MKKLFIVALAAFVSACACFDCEDEAPVTTYQSSRQSKMDCDYFDGKTCYRYTYRNAQRPVAQPIVYREQPRCRRTVQQVQYQPRPCPTAECQRVIQRPCPTAECPRAVQRQVSSPCGSSSCTRTNCGCSAETKVSETREPVEVIYKKTTLKTVYEPRTYSEVSYEKAPYNSLAPQEPVEVVETTDRVVIEDVQ